MNFMLLCLDVVGLSIALENIALNKPAYQHNPYSGPIPSHLTEASNAVDGLYQNLSVWGGQCVYSDDGQQTATLWVNLTRIFNIYLIDIKFMAGNSSWGLSNTFASRMLGFSIYVSNTTNKSEGKLCYKNYFTDISDLTRHWKVECVTIGQYVFFYNERLKGVTYPKGYSTYAYNDVCELMVWGCPTPGFYGWNCSIPCPDRNCRYCRIDTGACQSCNPGYQGHRCEHKCDDINGCKADYTEIYCRKDWETRFYGMTVAFFGSFVLLISYVIHTRKAGQCCSKRCKSKKQTKQTESYYIETYENEVANPTYQELGEIKESTATYINAE